ncbi:MAG: Ppx/GppA phosphatase family protein [Pseudomonadota bacterium]
MSTTSKTEGKQGRGRRRSASRHGRGSASGKDNQDRDGAKGAALAALDLGTNNCRLLVARAHSDEFKVVDAFSRAVRLGEGVETTNRLSDTAQDRAIKALRICASKIRHHKARLNRIIATEACRRATNSAAFVERVKHETGLRLDVITAEEEARLAVAGCSPLIDREAEQLLVFDIGGGSTELIWIDLTGTRPADRPGLVRALSPTAPACPQSDRPRARVADWISLPMGVSTLTDRFAGIADERLRFIAMAAYVEAAMAPFAPVTAMPRPASIERLQVIGVSGTATTFGAIHLGLRSYSRDKVDGLWLEAQAADRVAARLLEMGPDGRNQHPGIGSGRSGLVLSGAAILMTILRTWPVRKMRIADRGLREGMLYGLLQQSRVAAG